MTEPTKHYFRDWLSSTEYDSGAVEFFCHDSHSKTYFSVGYTIKSRNTGGVFLMLDVPVSKDPNFATHIYHLRKLNEVLDQIHDILIRHSETTYPPKRWDVPHVDIYSTANIMMESNFKGSHRLLFTYGTKSVHFNCSTQEMIDIVLTIKKGLEIHHTSLGGEDE